jgi:hypothetical protein
LVYVIGNEQFGGRYFVLGLDMRAEGPDSGKGNPGTGWMRDKGGMAF